MGSCQKQEKEAKETKEARQKAIVKGWYGHNNLGDESYKITFPKVFGDKYNLNFSDAASLNDDHEAVFVGGGDIFSEEFLEDILYHSSKKCYAASVTLPDDPCLSVIDRMEWIAVRDKKSYSVLTTPRILTQQPKAYYCPDFAFILEANPYRGKEIISRLFAEEKRDLYQNKIAVVINSHLLSKPGDATKKHIAFENLCFQLAEVCDNANASFLFLPFSTQMPWDDRISCGMAASRCKFWKKNLVAYDRLSVQDALDVLSAVDMTISTRLHSTIFSIVGGKPVIDLTHNHKNSRLLDDLEMSEFSIDYWRLSSNEIFRHIESCVDNKEELEAECELKVEEQRKQIERFKKDVCSLQ